MRLFVRPRCEEQRVARSGRRVVAELERPETVNRERLAVGAAQLAGVLEAAPDLPIGVDLPIAEVADEKIAAETAEARGSQRKAPGSVQLTVLGDAAEQVARRVVRVDEAESLAGFFLVLFLLVLLRVRDEDLGPDRLDSEGRLRK